MPEPLSDHGCTDYGYVPPKPDSWRCRHGWHVPTIVPPEHLAALAQVGAYKPGKPAADSCPWPGGYVGTPVFAWCTRCGAELEPEKVAAALAAFDAEVAAIRAASDEKRDKPA